MGEAHHLAELNIGRQSVFIGDYVVDASGVRRARAWFKCGRAARMTAAPAILLLSACNSMVPPPLSTAPEASGNYEVSGSTYQADFFKGAPYIEQERDQSGRLKLVDGKPVEVELVFMDAAGVNPKIVVSRMDGTPMGVEDEATALRVAAVLCADKGRAPMKRAGPDHLPPPATLVLEAGQWGVFNLCR